MDMRTALFEGRCGPEMHRQWSPYLSSTSRWLHRRRLKYLDATRQLDYYKLREQWIRRGSDAIKVGGGNGKTKDFLVFHCKVARRCAARSVGGSKIQSQSRSRTRPKRSRSPRGSLCPTQKKRATRLLAALVAVAPPLHVLAVVDKEVFFAEQPQVYDAPRTLVLAQSVDTFKEGYASLISDLEARGHAVTYASLTQKKTPLFAYGEKLYEHVVLAPGGAAFPAPAVKPVLIIGL
eukprot:g3624.t1